MVAFRFNSQIEQYDKIDSFSQEEIKNEPMLFSCDINAARKFGGPITETILATLPNDWEMSKLIIDTRVHMLMPGWYPCIPGWHHDDVPRTLNNQPNYHCPEYKSEHLVCVLNADICPTEFALGECSFPDVTPGQIYYKVWHPMVDKAIENGKLNKVKIQDGVITRFNWNTWHQGTKAVKNGWRFFFRATRNTQVKPKNELRRQVQVYLEFPMEGW